MAQFQPILGKRLRITKLDECGNPPADGEPCAFVVTKGFISVTLSSEVESGTEIVTRTADGNLCVNERMADSFKRFTVGISFCGVDPDTLALTTNAEPYPGYLTDGSGDGIVIPEGMVDGKFALELWTGLTGAACQPGVEEASGYLLLPFVNAGTLGDLEINGENAIDFSLAGAYTQGGNAWGTGPYDVLDTRTDIATGSPTAGALPSALDPLDHLLLIETGIAPPAVTDGCQPMGGGAGGATATGATAGAPGSYTPSGATAPANLSALQSGSVTASPTTAWTTGQSVKLGDNSDAHWDGTGWVAGVA